MSPAGIIAIGLCAGGLAAAGLILRRHWRFVHALREARRHSGPECNQFRFAVQSVDTAKAIILTPEQGVTTEERWQKESQAIKEILLPRIPAGATVLDFGTGIGRNLKALADERADICLIGVDASPDMRRLASEYVGHADRLTIVDNLSAVATASVDLAISTYVLQHVSGHVLEEVISHLHRVLKAGGRLFIIDCRYRLVPEITELERAARNGGVGSVDTAVHKVARSEHGSESAWKGDGLSVVKLLKRQFGRDPIHIRPDPARFGPITRRDSVFAFFEKPG